MYNLCLADLLAYWTPVFSSSKSLACFGIKVIKPCPWVIERYPCSKELNAATKYFPISVHKVW